MFNSNAFRSTALIFTLIVSLIFLVKPTFFFGLNGQIKVFGFQQTENETPVPLPILIYGLLALLYIIILYIDIKIIAV